MKKKINIPYGESTIELELDSSEIEEIITPHDVSVPENLEDEIVNALKNPIGCGTIEEIVYEKAREKETEPGELDIVVISDDNTRLTPVDKFLPFILAEFKKAGISCEQIKIVMALGTHRDMTEDEMIDKVGCEIYKNIEIINHEFKDENELVNLGTTENGTPVYINRHVCDADLVIGLGSIVPHHIPGFSGGAKIVQPGVCGGETTGYTHLLSVRKRRSFLGFIENPVRREMEEIARSVGVDYILNAVLNRNGEVYRLVFGDIAAAFREGVKAARQVYEVEVKTPTKVTLAGSFPCNLEFWQAHKSLYPADMITEEGGMIIVLTPCYEGVAVTHSGMLNFTSFSPEKIDQMVENDEIEDKVGAALAIAWSKITERVEVVLVSEGINKKEASALNFTYAKSIDEAFQLARKKYGKQFKLNILTHAPDTLPVLKD